MSDLVKLIGLDFGTTTSSAVVATTRLVRSAVGRVDFDSFHETFRSEMVFTPLKDDRLDVHRIEELLEGWLAAGQVQPAEIFGGGALLTGLTAQKENAAALVQLIVGRLGNALIASADDPCLESWLTFMGSAASVSRAHPERCVLNLDIGGGTTNLALGQAGEVLSTGCLFVGARHVQVEPGSYRIVKVSKYGRALLEHLGVAGSVGDMLREAEVAAIIDVYIALLTGQVASLPAELVKLHEQVPLRLPESARNPIVTFSGGVGELIYTHLDGQSWPATTSFGDLGIDLARRLVQEERWRESLGVFRPASAGRATVYGLLRHSTEVSGSTLFLPDPTILPLVDLPILGCLRADASRERIAELLDLVRRSPSGGCLQVDLKKGSKKGSGVFLKPDSSPAGHELKRHEKDSRPLFERLGKLLAAVLRESSFPADRPLVMLMRENLGKVLGNYATEWGRLPVQVVVIDEVSLRDAQFAQIGAARGPVVPVSFHGFAP